MQGRNSDGWRGIPTNGLQHNGGRFNADVAQLLCHQEAMLFIADNQWLADIVGTSQSGYGVLQHGLAAQ